MSSFLPLSFELIVQWLWCFSKQMHSWASYADCCVCLWILVLNSLNVQGKVQNKTRNETFQPHSHMMSKNTPDCDTYPCKLDMVTSPEVFLLSEPCFLVPWPGGCEPSQQRLMCWWYSSKLAPNFAFLNWQTWFRKRWCTWREGPCVTSVVKCTMWAGNGGFACRLMRGCNVPILRGCKALFPQMYAKYNWTGAFLWQKGHAALPQNYEQNRCTKS